MKRRVNAETIRVHMWIDQCKVLTNNAPEQSRYQLSVPHMIKQLNTQVVIATDKIVPPANLMEIAQDVRQNYSICMGHHLGQFPMDEGVKITYKNVIKCTRAK